MVEMEEDLVLELDPDFPVPNPPELCHHQQMQSISKKSGVSLLSSMQRICFSFYTPPSEFFHFLYVQATMLACVYLNVKVFSISYI